MYKYRPHNAIKRKIFVVWRVFLISLFINIHSKDSVHVFQGYYKLIIGHCKRRIIISGRNFDPHAQPIILLLTLSLL